MTDLVERVARRIYALRFGASAGPWDEAPDWIKAANRNESRAAIALALEEAARVAENHREPNPFPTRQRAIAAAIRAMVVTDPGTAS
jgi:hypothetical protein